MRLSSDLLLIERAQPWLGTTVSIQVVGLPEREAHRAIDAAFQEIATVHHAMSFHRHASDVSRLNRSAPGKPIQVHPYTYDVVRWALRIAGQSQGRFDISVGADLINWGLLPRFHDPLERSDGSWRDVELLPDHRIQFHRPLRIDLGGIAKGYAVDRAIETLCQHGAVHAVVNAGGDLRVHGEAAQRIYLDLEFPQDPAPVLELTNGSAASSSGHRNRRKAPEATYGPHVHGITRSPAPTDRFVCVLAPLCVVADSLTKIVMTDDFTDADLLQPFEAVAYAHDPQHGWRYFSAGGVN